MRVTDEKERVKALESIGISDGNIELDKNIQSLSIGLNEVFDINKTMKNQKKQISAKSVADDILGGLDFD